MFKCLDWDKELLLKPNYSSIINISLVPCDQFEEFVSLEPNDECIADKE